MATTTGPVGDFGRGRTIFVLAVVVGCFAVLWPKVFYPMFTASIYQPGDADDHGHIRPERPFRPDIVHPALREKGRAIPTPTLPRRTIEREARPGPVPGVRPPVGGAGHVPTAPKGSGTMGIIMPMYTIGIVCFFVYTLVKILFKKTPDDGNAPATAREPILKDYGLDPEHRKFVCAEEYADNSEKSLKDPYNKEDRELGIRRKSSGGKSRFHEDKRRLELETDPAEGEQNLVESEYVEQIDTPKEVTTSSSLLDELETSSSTTFKQPETQIHETDLEVETPELCAPIVEIPIPTFETSVPQPQPLTASETAQSVLSSAINDLEVNKVSEEESAVTPAEIPTPTQTVDLPIPPPLPIASETSDLKLIDKEASSSMIPLAEVTTPETELPSSNTASRPIDPKILGGVTEEDLTSAALFFDRTIEIPEEVDFESSLTTREKLLDEIDTTQPFPIPSVEIVEYANSLADQILEEATSTITTSNVFLLSLEKTDNSPAETIDDQPLTLIIPTPRPEYAPINIEQHDDASKTLVTSTDGITDPPDQASTFESIIIPVPIIVNTAVNADIISDNYDTNQTHVEPASAAIIVSEVDAKVDAIEGNSIRKSLEIPVEQIPSKGPQSESCAPVITLADDIRKSSEPILSRQISDVQITPVEDISGDPLLADVLGGYVTMVDEGKSRPPRGILKHFKSGVEITSFDEDIGVEADKESGVVHRVMSMDSNDSVETVKELSLDSSIIEEDLTIKEDHFGKSQVDNVKNVKIDILGDSEIKLAEACDPSEIVLSAVFVPEVKDLEKAFNTESAQPEELVEVESQVESSSKIDNLAGNNTHPLTNTQSSSLTKLVSTTIDTFDNEKLVVDIPNVLDATDALEDSNIIVEPLAKENVIEISSNIMHFVEESASTSATTSDPIPSASTVEIPSPVEIQNEPESLPKSQLESTTNDIIIAEASQPSEIISTEVEKAETEVVNEQNQPLQSEVQVEDLKVHETEQILASNNVTAEEVKTDKQASEGTKTDSQDTVVETVKEVEQEPRITVSSPATLTEISQKLLTDTKNIQSETSEISTEPHESQDKANVGKIISEKLVESSTEPEIPNTEVPLTETPTNVEALNTTAVNETIPLSQEISEITEEKADEHVDASQSPVSKPLETASVELKVESEEQSSSGTVSTSLDPEPVSRVEESETVSTSIPAATSEDIESKQGESTATLALVEPKISSTTQESVPIENEILSSSNDLSPSEPLAVSIQSVTQIQDIIKPTTTLGETSESIQSDTISKENADTPVDASSAILEQISEDQSSLGAAQGVSEPESKIQVDDSKSQPSEIIIESSEIPKEEEIFVVTSQQDLQEVTLESPIDNQVSAPTALAVPEDKPQSNQDVSVLTPEEGKPQSPEIIQESAEIPQEKVISVSSSTVPEENQTKTSNESQEAIQSPEDSPSSIPEPEILKRSEFIPLEFEPLEFEEIEDPGTILEAMSAGQMSQVPSTPTMTSSVVACEFEIEFVPPAESQNVPPVQPASNSSPLQPSLVALDTSLIVNPPNKETSTEETIISEEIPVITPENLPSSSIFTTTITSEPLLTSDIDKKVGVAIDTTTTTPASTFEIETIDSLGNNQSAKRDEILGETEGAQDAPGIQPSTGESPVEKATVATNASVATTAIPSEVASTDAAVRTDGKANDVQAIDVAPTEISQPVGVANKDSGTRDRDAIITAVTGILEALGEQSASKNESLSKKPESENKQQSEEDSTRRKGPEPILSRKSPSAERELKSQLQSSMKKQSSVEKEVKFQLPPKDSEEEEDEPEEEIVRPPTPPRTLSKKSKHPNSESSVMISKYAQDLSETILQQSAAAAIAAAKAQGSGGGHKDSVSVIGFEETAELESGEKWDDRTPTPTFRMATPPVPHRPPTPPEDIPSIFLEGPLPAIGQQLIVSDSQVEVEGGDLYDEDADYDNYNAPVVLSGKVTLSVISGLGDGAPDEITDAPSLSYEDKAQAGNTQSNNIDRSKKDGLASAIRAEKSLSSAKKSPASSPDMEEYEVIKKGGFSNYDEEDNDDVDITSYMTAEADNDEGANRVQEDTAGDISVMEGLEEGKNDELPRDEDKGEE